MDKAASDFKQSLKLRPNDKQILESLVKCFKDRDEVAANGYRAQIAEIEKIERDAEANPEN